ncbi:MAG: hypothetical protein HS115_08870 [Spirochaetales bacterium]|nr:hypothetical protein [Spirochaetales bacterium]
MAISEYYTNAIEINISPFELELRAMVMDSQGQPRHGINIRMSPQTAWALQKVLAKQIANYENNIGPITLPEEIRKNLE